MKNRSESEIGVKENLVFFIIGKSFGLREPAIQRSCRFFYANQIDKQVKPLLMVYV